MLFRQYKGSAFKSMIIAHPDHKFRQVASIFQIQPRRAGLVVVLSQQRGPCEKPSLARQRLKGDRRDRSL